MATPVLRGGINMSGVKKDGVDMVAGGEGDFEELVHGGGGYEGGTVTGAADSEARGSGRRGEGGHNGGAEDSGSYVQRQIRELEKKIKECMYCWYRSCSTVS